MGRMMAAGIWNDYIEQGAAYFKRFYVRYKGGTAVDLSGYEVRMQMRSSFDGPVIKDLPFAGYWEDTAYTDLPKGVLGLYIGASETSVLPAGSYVYDIEIYNPSDADDVLRLLQGTMRVTGEVTQ